MTDIELVIKMDEKLIEWIDKYYNNIKGFNGKKIGMVVDAIKNGKPIPKGHGRLIDISKIEKDRIEKDNPIIYLTTDGNYTEAVSLDYLNDLPTIIEADKAESE